MVLIQVLSKTSTAVTQGIVSPSRQSRCHGLAVTMFYGDYREDVCRVPFICS